MSVFKLIVVGGPMGKHRIIFLLQGYIFIDIRTEYSYNKNKSSDDDQIHVLRGGQDERCMC